MVDDAWRRLPVVDVAELTMARVRRILCDA